ncbi:MAG: DUF2164 family protein [Christensenellaceae bacterium]|jgi:uncharacterized protein (DUF2164 family)|nr:DUF2164 family protein [Christensenellaceae bacterium]
MKKKEPWSELPKEERDELLARLKHLSTELLELELGELKARLLLEELLALLGPLLYNLGVEDAAALMAIRVEDLYSLMKP